MSCWCWVSGNVITIVWIMILIMTMSSSHLSSLAMLWSLLLLLQHRGQTMTLLSPPSQLTRYHSPESLESPFLFTSWVRLVTERTEEYLTSHGAGLFARLWSSHSSPSPPVTGPRPSSCLLPPEWRTGCLATSRVPQWTYSKASSSCVPYWYTGCGATNNLYSNEYKCRLQCHRNHEGRYGHIHSISQYH